jgi:hypothetical protein
MKPHATITILAQPQDSLRALQKAVAQQFDLRLLTGGTPEQPLFVLEKRVRYPLLRGLPLDVLYQVTGDFEQTPDGKTALHYAVSGQWGMALLQAVFHMLILVGFAFLFQIAVFAPPLSLNWIGVVMVVVLYASVIVYAWLAYRRYHEHLRSLEQFMREFAQRMSAPSR